MTGLQIKQGMVEGVLILRNSSLKLKMVADNAILLNYAVSPAHQSTDTQFPVDYHIPYYFSYSILKQSVLNILFAHQFVKSYLKNTPSNSYRSHVVLCANDLS